MATQAKRQTSCRSVRWRTPDEVLIDRGRGAVVGQLEAALGFAAADHAPSAHAGGVHVLARALFLAHGVVVRAHGGCCRPAGCQRSEALNPLLLLQAPSGPAQSHSCAPSPAIAAAVGAITAVALLLFRLWLATHGADGPLPTLAWWVLATAILVIAPAYFLVIGAQGRPLAQQWFKDPAEVARVMAMASRMTVWFLAFVATTVVLQFFRN